MAPKRTSFFFLLCGLNLRGWKLQFVHILFGPASLLPLRNRFRFVDDWNSYVLVGVTELEFEDDGTWRFGTIEIEFGLWQFVMNFGDEC
jgi:hypothetical protein